MPQLQAISLSSASQESFIPSHSSDVTSPESAGPTWQCREQQEVLFTEWLCLPEPGAARCSDCPQLHPRGQRCSGPPASAATAQQTGHSGTRTAGPAAASMYAPPPAPPWGLAHSLCSQAEGHCSAAGHPVAQERGSTGPWQAAVPSPPRCQEDTETGRSGGMPTLPPVNRTGCPGDVPKTRHSDSMASLGLRPRGGEAGQRLGPRQAASGA